MSTIPLPALDLKQQEQPDIASQLGRVAQLRSLGQQQQAGAIDLQQKQQALSDQQAATAAMHDWDGKDMQQLPSLMLKHGASATAVIGMKQHILSQQETISKMAEQDATAGSKNIETQAAKNNLLLGQLSAVTSGPDEGLGKRVTDTAKDAVTTGLLDPQHFQVIQQLAQEQDPAKLRSNLSLLEKGLQGQKEQFDQAQKQLTSNAQAYKDTNIGNEAAVNTQKNQMIVGGMDSQGVTAEQRQAAAQKAQELRLQSQRNFLEGKRVGLEGQRVGLEGQRVDIENKKLTAGEIPLDQITNTTKAGRSYISMDDLPKDKYGSDAMKRQAAAAGIPVVNKDTASMLSDIDTAKANQQYMLDTIGKKLAAGAPERLWYGPANTIQKMMQSDPEMAAVGTYRSAAIQSMRAVAGSKGLRINKSEIETAQDNDVPKLTDTLPVAQAKLKNLGQFMEDIEAAHLNRNRQANAPQQVQTPQVAGQSAPGKVLTSSAIQQAAKDHGVSVDEATRQAKAAGYQIQ